MVVGRVAASSCKGSKDGSGFGFDGVVVVVLFGGVSSSKSCEEGAEPGGSCVLLSA